MAVGNTLDYYDTATIMDVKSLIIQTEEVPEYYGALHQGPMLLNFFVRNLRIFVKS
jgi:hypothetical protein